MADGEERYSYQDNIRMDDGDQKVSINPVIKVYSVYITLYCRPSDLYLIIKDQGVSREGVCIRSFQMFFLTQIGIFIS